MLAVLLVMAAVILAETSALFAREFFKTKERRTEQRQRRTSRGISQCAALGSKHKRKRRCAQPKEQAAHKINMQFK